MATNAEATLLVKIAAARDKGVSNVFAGVEAEASRIKESFSEAAAQASALAKALKDLTAAAQATGKGFIAGGAEAQKSLADTEKAAQAASAAAKKKAEEEVAAVRAAEQQKAAARKKAADNLRYALQEEEKYRVAASAAAQKAAAQEASALAKTRAEMAKNAQSAKELATAMTVGLGAAGAALAGLSSYALSVANSFEQLQAQLATVQGSSEVAAKTIANAQAFAAKTPFDLEGVVKATVQLEVYGQKSQEVLPRVAALAAGMGKSLTDTSLVVGKALSGSLEGFESLRNEYGITTRELVRFGAEQNKAGGILVQSAGQAEKARKALLAIIDLRYGDAIERQSQTLAGQLEKVSDGIKTFVGEVGRGTAEVVKFGAAFVGGGFDLLRKIPQPLKEAAGAALAIGAAATAAAAGVGTLVGGLAFLIPRLADAKNAFIAIGGAQGAMFVFEQRCNALGLTAIPRIASALAALAGPIAVVGSAAAAFGVLMTVTNRYIDTQKQLQAEMKREDAAFKIRIEKLKEMAQASRELNAEEEKRAGQSATGTDSFTPRAERLDEIKKLTETSSASDFFKKFKELGLDAEQVRTELQKMGPEIDSGADKVEKLRKELLKAQQAENLANARSASLGGATIADPRRLALENELRVAEQQLERTKEYEESLKLIDKRYESNAVSLDKVTAAAKAAEDYANYANKAKDLDGYTRAAEHLRDSIAASAVALKELNEPADRDSLLERLRDPKLSDEIRTRIKEHIDLVDDLADAEKEAANKRKEATRDEVADLERRLQRKKALQQVSAQEELVTIKQQIDLVKKLGKDGEDQLTELLRKEAALRTKIRTDEAAAAKKSALAALTEAARVPAIAKTAQAGTQAAVGAYKAAIARVQEWTKENDALIKKNTELGTRVKSTLEQLKVGMAAADTKRLAKNLDDLKDKLKEMDIGARSVSEKLSVLQRGEQLIRAARSKNEISEEQSSDLLRENSSRTDDLKRQGEQEEARHRQEMLSLQQQAAQQELDLLKTIETGTLQSYDKILVATERLHQLKLQQLAEERDAAIQSGEERVQAEEQYNAKVAALEKQRTLEHHQELQKRYQEERKQLEDIVKKGESQKKGLTFGFSDSASFSSFGTSDEDYEARKAARKAKADLADLDRKETFRKLNPEIVSQMAEEDRQRALRAADPSGIIRDAQAKMAPQTAPSSTINNNNISVTVNTTESRKTRNVRDNGEALREVQKALTINRIYDPQAGLD